MRFLLVMLVYASKRLCMLCKECVVMIELQKSNAQITFTTPTVMGGSGGYVDLSDYYTKDEVDNLI